MTQKLWQTPASVLGLLLASVASAQATATLDCAAHDRVVQFSAEGTVGRNAGERMVGFKAELRLARRAAAGFDVVRFTAADLTQRWISQSKVKLRLHRDTPRGTVEMVVAAEGGEDGLDMRGSYTLSVEPAAAPRAPRTFRGRATCSIG